MKSYRVRFTPEAARLIAKFPPKVKKLIRSAIDDLREDPRRGSDSVDEFAGYRSLKPKRYRIIYRVNEAEAAIESITQVIAKTYMKLSSLALVVRWTGRQLSPNRIQVRERERFSFSAILFEPRLAQRRNMPLQHRRIFDRNSLLCEPPAKTWD